MVCHTGHLPCSHLTLTSSGNINQLTRLPSVFAIASVQTCELQVGNGARCLASECVAYFLHLTLHFGVHTEFCRVKSMTMFGK